MVAHACYPSTLGGKKIRSYCCQHPLYTQFKDILGCKMSQGK